MVRQTGFEPVTYIVSLTTVHIFLAHFLTALSDTLYFLPIATHERSSISSFNCSLVGLVEVVCRILRHSTEHTLFCLAWSVLPQLQQYEGIITFCLAEFNPPFLWTSCMKAPESIQICSFACIFLVSTSRLSSLLLEGLQSKW